MTKETFERAEELRREIYCVQSTVEEMFKVDGFKLEPITRQSGIYLRFGNDERSPVVHLTEGEALCIRNALKNYKEDLEYEFGRL